MTSCLQNHLNFDRLYQYSYADEVTKILRFSYFLAKKLICISPLRRLFRGKFLLIFLLTATPRHPPNFLKP